MMRDGYEEDWTTIVCVVCLLVGSKMGPSCGGERSRGEIVPSLATQEAQKCRDAAVSWSAERLGGRGGWERGRGPGGLVVSDVERAAGSCWLLLLLLKTMARLSEKTERGEAEKKERDLLYGAWPPILPRTLLLWG